MVLHDLNLAARYADDLIAMREGGMPSGARRTWSPSSSCATCSGSRAR